MRRARGPRAPVTIETYELLAQLYTSTGQAYQVQAAKGEKTAGLAQEYFKKAVGVHEDILRLVVHEHGSGEDSDDDDEFDATAALLAREGVSVKPAANAPSSAASAGIDRSAIALKHLHLLKLGYQRLGGWPKPYADYERLNAQVFRVFGAEPQWKGIEGTEKWDAKAFGSGKAESNEGGFGGVRDWGFGSDRLILDAQRVQQGGAAGGQNGVHH